MIERSTGGAQPNISQDIIRNLEIPLPPLPEQRRIAEVLDKADALREKRRLALQKLDTLLQSVFVEMFGDPVKNPKGLEKSRFGNIFKSVRYGTGSPPAYIANGNPFIRATNIKTGTVILKDLKFISDEDAKKIEKCRVSYGDLIVVRSGVNSGDCAMIPKKFDGAFAAYDLIVELGLYDAIFYNYLINSDFGKQTIGKLTRRAAQPHLNAEQLSSIKFIRPNPAETERFVLFYQKVEELKGKFNFELSKLENLFQSLQQKAFKGELFIDEFPSVKPQDEKVWQQTSLF